jgi:thiamine kinase-like enzyme
MIPENKKEAVVRALQAAFGTTEFEDISALTAGLSSALIFRIVVLGKPYLLRIIIRTDAIADPTIHFNAMKIASEAGIAPHIWYTSIEDRISITDFIEAKPFGIDDARTMLPAVLRCLHSQPAFPYRLNYFDAMNGFAKKFREAKLLPESVTSEVFALYDKITAVYSRDGSDWVSCHNDLKPENILFDGSKLWLVDWEAGFLNDPYLDLAIVANFAVRNKKEEMSYLNTYFGQDTNEYQHARFFLMQQILHMAYFTVFMLSSSSGQPVDPHVQKPDFREFHDRMWAGKISLDDNNMKLQYAWVHLEQLRRNLLLQRFHDSLSILSRHSA